MSLAAVYDAFRSVGVDEAKATAAMEAIETVREEPRLRRIEERITALQADITAFQAEVRGEIRLLKWICGFNTALGFTTLAIVIRLAFGG